MTKPFRTLIEDVAEFRKLKFEKTYLTNKTESHWPTLLDSYEDSSSLPNELLVMALEALEQTAKLLEGDLIYKSVTIPMQTIREQNKALEQIRTKLEGASK